MLDEELPAAMSQPGDHRERTGIKSAPPASLHRPPSPDAVSAPFAAKVGDLVQPGWVHSAVYTDEDVFGLEMGRIFHRSWVYVGHESEIKAKGEFRLRRIGRQPVIFVRGADDVVRVLLNRCRHRGAAVCEKTSGREKLFRCWYHGWTYDNTGKLVSVTAPEGYGPDFDLGEHSLTPAPRMESYRGFYFASLSGEGVSLTEHLGLAAPMIDLLIDAAPEGVIDVNAGYNRTAFKGNWKLVGMDGYHPQFVHASVYSLWQRDANAGTGATHRADPFDAAAISQTRDLQGGHAMLDLRKHRALHLGFYRDYLGSVPGGADYIAKIEERHSAERADEILASAGDPHVGIFPNLQLIGNQIRVINPISAGETEVIMFPVTFEGVSREINVMRLRQHEFFYGPASSGSPDDAEIFERVQQGLAAVVDPWIDVTRGMNRETVEPDGSIVGHISDEVPQRAQMRQWRKLMRAS
jgi:phenylpropionate dioxygenase-like ring-hydroxylating dioxygenase large terminal subunit